MAGLNQFNPQQLGLGGQRTDDEFLRFLDQLDQRLGRERILPGPELGAQLQGGGGPDFATGAQSFTPTQLPDEIPLGSKLGLQGSEALSGRGGLGAFFSGIKDTASSPLGNAILLGNLSSTDFSDRGSVTQSVGSTIGGLAGASVGGPVGGAIGSVGGSLLGGLFGGDDDEEERKKEEKKQQTRQSLQNAALFFARSNARKGIPSFF